MIKPRIDVSRHLASRRAMKAVLDRQKVFIVMRKFDRGMTARVLVGGEYYDVDQRQLSLLFSGRSPADLDLYPVSNGPEE